MEKELINEGGFNYIENGDGRPIIILHGLMGGLSNFKGVYDYFPSVEHKVIIPELPVDSTPILKTNVTTPAVMIVMKIAPVAAPPAT